MQCALRVFLLLVQYIAGCFRLLWVGCESAYCHNSDVSIQMITHKFCSIMQAGRSLVMRYSTHAVTTPLLSDLVRLNVHLPDLF